MNCEGIPKVLDWSYESDRLTIITEYVDGCDLHQFIQMVQGHNMKISVHLKKYIIEAIFQSLKALHEAGICHGDLKPSNILLSVDGRVKIIDICLGDHGLIYATPEFSAPEVLAGNRPDSRSDLYSLGLIAQALEFPDCKELLQIKPGLRRYKKMGKLNLGQATSELSTYVWQIKYEYEFDSCELDHRSIKLNRKPIDQVAMSTVEYHLPMTQEGPVPRAKAVSEELLEAYKTLKSFGPQWLRIVGLGACFLLVMSSQMQRPLLGMATVRFRSLKAFEVWDAGRWNSVPYDYRVSLENPKTLLFKLRSNNKVGNVSIESRPYKSEIVEIDAL